MDQLEKLDRRELISALADGQLRGEGFARGVAVATSGEGRSTWEAYCVIGEVLRTGQSHAGSAPGDFLAKLQARLGEEPARPAAPAEMSVRAREEAANDWRWKLAAGFASVAAVAAIGWNVWGTAGGNGAAGPQLAVAPSPASGVIPVAAASDPRSAPMIRDPRLDQLLAAHRQFGGATALQTSSGFLRNATFEGPNR